MAVTSIPNGAKPPVKFNYISSYNVLMSLVSSNAIVAKPEQLIKYLHDGITKKQGAYGAVLFYSSTYIEFEVLEDARFWATSSAYTDSGGTSGKDINIYKYDTSSKSYVLYETSKTNTTEEWYVISNRLLEGRYKISGTSNYTLFDEFYFESLNEKKSFIFQNDGYKVFRETTKGQIAENKVPLMTSNTAPYGLAKANDYWGTGYEPYKAFNRIKTNAAANGWATTRDTPRGWLSYTFQDIIYVDKYVITPREAIYAPISWSIEIDKGDGNLEVVDTKTNFTSWSDITDTTFKLSKPFKCREFRINVIDSNSGGITIIQNLEIHSALIDTVLSNWLVLSPSLPNLNQYKEHGMILSNLDRKVLSIDPIKMDKRNDGLETGDGFVFSKIIDLKKYLDLRKINIEVR